jgi:hypothetical protein
LSSASASIWRVCGIMKERNGERTQPLRWAIHVNQLV